jgi:hypothetical protein
VPGGLDVPALDRNQSPLPFPFHLARLLIRSASTAHKGGDPRQELTIPSFFKSRLCSPNLCLPCLCAMDPASIYARSYSTLCGALLALPYIRAFTYYPAFHRICLFLCMRVNHPYIASLAASLVLRDTRSTGHHRKPCCSMHC